MRRRDWLKSIATLAVVPLIGVRKAVAAAETVTPAPPTAETVTEPVLRGVSPVTRPVSVWPPEAIWINGEMSDEAPAFGGPKDGEVLPGGVTKYRSYPAVRNNPVFGIEYASASAGYDIHQYSRERIVLSSPNVRMFIDVWCYAGTGWSMTATLKAKAAALKWAHKKYGHLIRYPVLSVSEIRAKIRSLA